MIHLGDITKINGAEIEPVDCITAGSPCQDLSVAGKRAGLEGERSGLFMEQIRIIKEMRENDRNNGRTDEFVRPRYMVWENVPGAFSSNKGEDFRCVLEETAKVAERDAVIPKPPKGKWSKSGAIMGDGWSIAWRVHDAQFWGVPQRRKRIALVADFGGESAPEILFERKGLSRDITESGKEGQGITTTAEKSIGKAISFQERAGKPGGGKGILIQNERTGALSTLNNQSVCAFEPGAASRVGGHVYVDDVAGTVRANAGDNQQAVVYNGGNPACNQGGMAVVSIATKQLSQNFGNNVAMPICANDYKEPQVVCVEGNGSHPSHKGDGYAESDIVYTLNSTEHHAICIENHPADSRVKISEDGMVQTLSSRMGTGGGNVPMVMEPMCIGNGQADQARLSDKVGALNCMHDQQAIVYAVDCRNLNESGISGTLQSKENGGYSLNYTNPVRMQSVVRRLTPMECERLQGYPDGWTDIGDWIDSKGKKHKGESDSPRYKALGNSIALPFWFYLLRRISAQYERPATLGSLFDGIGGFPLCWERCNGKRTARWASEIEEFPIAVTKHWFG